MLMVGEVDWTLVFAVLAAFGHAVALVAIVIAIRNGRRGHRAWSRLDDVRQTAATTDKRLFEILNAIPVALIQTDTQGKFTFANRAAHQLLGRRDVELLGLRFHAATWGITFPDGRIIPPDMLPTARALRGQTVKGFQHLLANPSTRRRMLVSVTAMPIMDEQGQIIGSTAAVVETEGLTTPEPVPLPAALPAVSPVEDPMTRRVFEAATQPVVVISVHGVIREANGLARALSADPVLEADFADIFVKAPDRVAARHALRSALSAAAGSAENLTTENSDGRTTIWNILPMMDASGRVDALLLTGEPAVEAAPEPVIRPEPIPTLEAVDEDSRRLEDIGRLSGGLAQDFGGLLAVMTGALEMVSDQAAHPEKVRRLAEAALAAGRRGEALTQRMAALTSGQMPLSAQAADMGVLLRGFEGRLQNVVRTSTGGGPGNVDLLILAPTELPSVQVDAVGFEAAVTALVRNAVQAEAGSVTVALEARNTDIILKVSDNGIGMDADTSHRATQAFFTTQTGSAGLGLVQAAAFARTMGGELRLDSRPGQGTEAILILPC